MTTFSDIPDDATRALVVMNSGEFDLQTAMDRTIRMLSRNPRGYFLMVEWDTHTDRIRRGLDRVVTLDRAIERTAKTAGPDTLLLFTADHSFDLRLRGGTLGGDFLEGLEAAEAESPKGPVRIPTLRMDNGHTGEEVLAAAQGPGAERVRGFMAEHRSVPRDDGRLRLGTLGGRCPRRQIEPFRRYTALGCQGSAAPAVVNVRAVNRRTNNRHQELKQLATGHTTPPTADTPRQCATVR